MATIAGATSGVYTKKITNTTYTVTADMGYSAISFLLTSGTATLNGNLLDSNAIDLVVNVPITIQSGSQAPLAGMVLTASSGVVQVMASY